MCAEPEWRGSASAVRPRKLGVSHVGPALRNRQLVARQNRFVVQNTEARTKRRANPVVVLVAHRYTVKLRWNAIIEDGKAFAANPAFCIS